MPRAVESFLKVGEVMKELTLVLQVFLNDESSVEDPFHYVPPSLLFPQLFLRLTLK
ncbi:hypothetical protein DPMN_083813 [Dreissena polymorpha]|uniref:Uncharacterized protein n=1 Tax=Dreissena polymorpha TaxID=45954 RepID=A0A9D4BHZ6_DREPO|nr:hypothetical protein DPMN_081648 [Dreissena polymorpha]KAH3696349.1 hypothetical protein DPMN_083813 [Dreissena polymorpha]